MERRKTNNAKIKNDDKNYTKPPQMVNLMIGQRGMAPNKPTDKYNLIMKALHTMAIQR